MQAGSGIFHVGVNTRCLHASERLTYQRLATALISKILDFMRPTKTRKFSPPFKLIIIDNCGAVAFKCQVSREGKVLQSSTARRVWLSQLPANALLTDRSLVTRTFRIERVTHGNPHP